MSKTAKISKPEAPKATLRSATTRVPVKRGLKKDPAPVPLARGFGSASIYDRLKSEILNLELAPGTLLDETDLSARFHMSRSPVREALIRLSAEGLVVTLRNRSTMVAPFDMSTAPSFLDAVNLIYRLTSRLAAMHRTPAQLTHIKNLYDQHQVAVKTSDLAAIVSLNRDFHVAIAEASGNAFFAQWARNLLDQGQRIMGMYLHDLDTHLPPGTLDSHVDLVLAIEARNPDAAENAGGRDAAIIADQMRARLLNRPVASFDIASNGAGRLG
jgi:DNA-binding GntR family transcriptional regulator